MTLTLCLCGCGREFVRKSRGRYFNNRCRQRDYRRRVRARVTMAAPKESHTSSQSTPSHASGSPEPLFIDIHTPKMGQRMVHLLGVGDGMVKVRFLGPEGEITWLPVSGIVGRYAPGDPEAGSGKVVKMDSLERESFLDELRRQWA